MEKLFFPKEIKDHESLWSALDPLKLISQNQAASSPGIGQFRMNNIFSFFHEVLGDRGSKKRFLYSMPETKFLQKGFCRETLFA